MVQLGIVGVGDVVGLGLMGVDGMEVLPVLGPKRGAPAHPRHIVFLFHHHLVGRRRIEALQPEFDARFLRLLLEHHQPRGMLFDAVGDLDRKAPAVFRPDPVGTPMPSGRLHVIIDFFKIKAAGPDVGVGIRPVSHEAAFQAVVIVSQHLRDHLFHVHGMGEGVADERILEDLPVLVEPETHGRLLGVVEKPDAVDVSVFERGRLCADMPVLRKVHRKGVDPGFLEIFPQDVHIPDHGELDPVDVESVFEIVNVVSPPVRLPFEHDVFALPEIRDLVGAGVGDDLPVVFSDEILADGFIIMTGRRGDAQFQVKIGHRLGAHHRQGMVVVDDDPVDLLGVVVVVPGRDDLLRPHEREGENEVVGRDRHPVRPPGLGIQLEIHGLLVRIEGPVGRQFRDDVERVGMEPDEAQLVAQDRAPEAAVGIGPHGPEGEGKAHESGVKGSAAPRLGRGEDWIVRVGEPLDVLRQRGRRGGRAGARRGGNAGEHYGCGQDPSFHV